MGRELGRISGPLLTENLKRNGHDLAFENQLLYLDVRNNRIGINANLSTTGPTVDLYVPIKIKSTNLIVDHAADTPTFHIELNTIQDSFGSITIRPDQSLTPTITAPGLTTDNFSIFSNSITNNTANLDINLTPYTGSKTNITTTVLTVDGNLHATGRISADGDIFLNGNVTFGNESSDTVKIIDELTQTIKPDQDNQFSLGSNPSTGGKNWKNLYTTLAQFGVTQFDSNTVTTTTSSDLVLTSQTNTVNVEYLKFVDNEIINVWPTATTNTQRSIIFAPNGTGNVLVNSGTSVIIPKGTNANRTLTSNGEIRYNTSFNNIEAYQQTGYVNFLNLYSQDRKTYVTGELTPNLSDDTLRFYVNNILTTTINPTTLYTPNLVADQITLTSNRIQPISNSQDLILSASSNSVNIDSFVSFDNTQVVTNTTNSALTFAYIGTGHWKFAGSNGVGIPVGNNLNHPASPEEGTVRFNTVTQAGEIYSNVHGWMPWVGFGNSIVTEAEDKELSLVYTLMLGL